MSFRKSLRTREIATGLDMTPTADMVFSMVLFLILTQNFLVCLPLDLPTTHSGESVDGNGALVLSLTASGTLVMDNTGMTTSTWRNELRGRLLRVPKEKPIFIEAHQRAPAGLVVEVLDELRLNARSRITFLSRPESAEKAAGSF